VRGLLKLFSQAIEIMIGTFAPPTWLTFVDWLDTWLNGY